MKTEKQRKPFVLKDRPWLRLYTSILNQYKVQRLSGDTFKFWINCLCLAARSSGNLPSIDDIGFNLRIPAQKVLQMLAILKDPKSPLVDEVDGRLRIHDWEIWQYEADNSTERVTAYRQRVKDAGRTVNAYLKHRDLVFERDEHLCIYCGSSENLCLDHVVPVVIGGDDEPDNLATACKSCNSGKSGRTPEQAGMTIRANCAYVTVYATNLSRLHVFKERRKGPRVTVTRNGIDSVSVSVSDSGSVEEGLGEADSGNSAPDLALPFGDDEFEARPPVLIAGLSIADWAERFYGRHPKKKNRPLVEQFFVDLTERWAIPAQRVRVSTREELFRHIDAIHVAWCGFPDWVKEGGKYCPKLDEWLDDETWRAGLPPTPGSPSSPSTSSTRRQSALEEALRQAREEEGCGKVNRNQSNRVDWGLIAYGKIPRAGYRYPALGPHADRGGAGCETGDEGYRRAAPDVQVLSHRCGVLRGGWPDCWASAGLEAA